MAQPRRRPAARRPVHARPATSTAACSSSPRTCTSPPTSSASSGSPPSTTGARSSRTSSARCCKARSAPRRAGSSAPTTRTRSTSRRSSGRASSSPGASASSPPARCASSEPLQAELLNYVVLDPACGSGNFLYVAYRELRRLEHRLAEREAQMRRDEGRRGADQGALAAFFPLQNMRGIDIDPFAVSLARVTLWMAHKLSVDELDLDERTLPLEDLSGIRAGDALRLPWPKASVIVGNPPFHGDRNLRGVVGDDYVEWLKREFDCRRQGPLRLLVPQDRTTISSQASAPDSSGRTRSRRTVPAPRASTTSSSAVASSPTPSRRQPWPGEAVVEVSIVNWIRRAARAADSLRARRARRSKGSTRRSTESTIPIADVPVTPGEPRAGVPRLPSRGEVRHHDR